MAALNKPARFSLLSLILFLFLFLLFSFFCLFLLSYLFFLLYLEFFYGVLFWRWKVSKVFFHQIYIQIIIPILIRVNLSLCPKWRNSIFFINRNKSLGSKYFFPFNELVINQANAAAGALKWRLRRDLHQAS